MDVQWIMIREFDSFHDSGHKLSWRRTKSNKVRLNVDLMGKSDLVLFSLVCHQDCGKNCL